MPKVDICQIPKLGHRKIAIDSGERLDINDIRAGYPGLYLVSHEEQRVDA